MNAKYQTTQEAGVFFSLAHKSQYSTLDWHTDICMQMNKN